MDIHVSKRLVNGLQSVCLTVFYHPSCMPWVFFMKLSALCFDFFSKTKKICDKRNKYCCLATIFS